MKVKNLITVMVLLVSVFAGEGYSLAYEIADGRVTYTAWHRTRGTTVTIPESTVYDLCGDHDGCKIRLGMYNWDGSRRTASRETLLYYDRLWKTWRASSGDKWGQNHDGGTDHIINAWACYFTDGEYTWWYNRGDYDLNFGLLSWKQYEADCKLTIID